MFLVDDFNKPLIVYRGQHCYSDAITSKLGSLSFDSQSIANLYAANPNNYGETTLASKVFPLYLTLTNPFQNTPADPFLELKHYYELDSFKQGVFLVGVNKLLNGGTFYITTLRQLIRLAQIEVRGRSVEDLAVLHCESYCDMDPDFAIQLRRNILKILGIDLSVIDVTFTEVKPTIATTVDTPSSPEAALQLTVSLRERIARLMNK